MNSSKRSEQFPTADHDHQTCVTHALQEAEDFCLQQGLRLTELRHRVLELIWANHQPVGAYDLLEQLTHEGRKAAPPTIYRSLDFLLENGLIHRITSLNAYVGCNHPGLNHAAQFFICEACGQAAELDDAKIESVIARDAKRLGFTVEKRTVEVAGICAHCKLRPNP
ncbi:MAG: transcriptional repressor [Candidatus Thiodiazotropha sp.]|nr:transcriptional repressor [Candidatus Thiodiazotropha sp.]MCU7803911.1 transcriptional repressor [Candidatus Thiodiazotropha sp. (ex Lucinoma borealis)]MCU7841742.1 transcriptional repressor [Candidatus Thiodiazotropha sp. (ex Troendleina suluensis)]MCU7885932.1 transcriptional repressor [Candidatus Thiodiazotropha sp. (ex Lucinoma annulata)]MCM8885506.1 transcriptional repressor [Candidatus Thiodiazotropha sp.]